MSSINFERKFFVKDLFQPKDFLNQFTEIEFESFQSFLNTIGNGFLSIGSEYKNNIIINNVDSIDQLKQFDQLLGDCKIDQEICLHLEKEFILKNDSIFNDLNFFTIKTDIMKEDDDFNLFLNSKPLLQRFQSTRFLLDTPINIDNWRYIFSLITEIYTKGVTRFFDLKFNYLSLDQMTLKDTREFEFRYKDLDAWKHANQSSWDFLTISTYQGHYKPIYVSKELKISLNKESYGDGEFVFNLAEHINHDGESVSQKELNTIRQYLDLKMVNSYFPIRNSKLINYYHNHILEGSIDELPLISFIVLGE